MQDWLIHTLIGVVCAILGYATRVFYQLYASEKEESESTEEFHEEIYDEDSEEAEEHEKDLKEQEEVKKEEEQKNEEITDGTTTNT